MVLRLDTSEHYTPSLRSHILYSTLANVSNLDNSFSTVAADSAVCFCFVEHTSIYSSLGNTHLGDIVQLPR